jgi:hypothetical protein
MRISIHALMALVALACSGPVLAAIVDADFVPTEGAQPLPNSTVTVALKDSMGTVKRTVRTKTNREGRVRTRIDDGNDATVATAEVTVETSEGRTLANTVKWSAGSAFALRDGRALPVRGTGFTWTPSVDWVWRTIPTFQAGTIKMPGGERPMAESPGTLDGPGFGIVGRGGPGGPSFSFSGGDLTGNTGATVAPGTDNLAYVYLDRQAGFTGVEAGATGNSLSIDSRLDWYDASIVWNKPLPFGFDGADAAYPAVPKEFFKIIGLDVGYRNMEQRIRQQNLTFSGVSQDTSFAIEELFLGARLGLGFHKDKGALAYGASMHVTPGVRVIDGEISQLNICEPCFQPELRNFTQRIAIDETRFDVRAGAGGWVSYRLAQNVRIGAQASYDYERLSIFDVPFTPTQQPPGLETDNSHRFRVGGFLVIEWGSRVIF